MILNKFMVRPKLKTEDPQCRLLSRATPEPSTLLCYSPRLFILLIVFQDLLTSVRRKKLDLSFL